MEQQRRKQTFAAYQALTTSLLRGAIGLGAVKATGVVGAITLTLAGLILLGSVLPSFQGAPANAEDVILRNGHSTDSDQKALFAFGNKTAPVPPVLESISIPMIMVLLAPLTLREEHLRLQM